MRSVLCDPTRICDLGGESAGHDEANRAIEGGTREPDPRIDEECYEPQQQEDGNDDAVELEVERQEGRELETADRHEENDDQERRDQAIPLKDRAMTDGEDGHSRQENREDACPMPARDSGGQQ